MTSLFASIGALTAALAIGFLVGYRVARRRWLIEWRGGCAAGRRQILDEMSRHWSYVAFTAPRRPLTSFVAGETPDEIVNRLAGGGVWKEGER